MNLRFTAMNEGYRQYVYDDANGDTLAPGVTVVGNPSLAYGWNVSPTGPGCDQELAQIILGIFLARIKGRLTATEIPGYPLQTFADLFAIVGAARTVALCDMCYNLGMGNFLEFKETFNALRSSDWEGAERAVLNSLAARQDPIRYRRIGAVFRLGTLPPDVELPPIDPALLKTIAGLA